MHMKKIINYLVIVFFASCDPVYDYTYEVTNFTYSEIEVIMKTSFRVSLESKVEIIKINWDETKVVLVTSHGVEPSEGPYFKDVTWDLDSFVVMKNNIVLSNKDYLDNSSWTYNNGFYRTTVTNAEFE